MAKSSKNPKNLRGKLLGAIGILQKLAVEVPGDKEVPEFFLCPYSRDIMIDPVTLSHGYTCDRSSIQKMIAKGLTACPITKQTLDVSHIWPNNLAREMIHDWCRKNPRYSDLVQYSSATPLYIKLGYMRSLHTKLQSGRLEDRREGAKELLQEVTYKSYFRKLYAEKPDAITHLLSPLVRSDEDSPIDPQFQEDVITALMIISANEKVKKVMARLEPEGIRVLVDGLRSENVETQRNAASIFFQLSSTDINSAKLGTRESIVELVTLLVEESSALCLYDAGIALFRLSYYSTQKETAVQHHVLQAIFHKIAENECVDVMLGILARLSSIQEGADEMERFGCSHLLRVIRESSAVKEKENATSILLNVLRKEGSKWKDVLKKEENDNGTISSIVQNGTPLAKKEAQEILKVLNSL